MRHHLVCSIFYPVLSNWVVWKVRIAHYRAVEVIFWTNYGMTRRIINPHQHYGGTLYEQAFIHARPFGSLVLLLLLFVVRGNGGFPWVNRVIHYVLPTLVPAFVLSSCYCYPLSLLYIHPLSAYQGID
jgi:hypothetical protein